MAESQEFNGKPLHTSLSGKTDFQYLLLLLIDNFFDLSLKSILLVEKGYRNVGENIKICSFYKKIYFFYLVQLQFWH